MDEVAKRKAVLEAAAEGRRFTRAADGGWRSGRLRLGDALAKALVGEGLLAERAGALAATAAGCAAGRVRPARLLAECAPGEPAGAPGGRRRPARSVTVNLAESTLGWLKARGHVSARQHEAGERLRGDWTVAGMAPRVTMRWDAAPRAAGPRGPDAPLDPALAQVAAKRRMDAALAAAGPGLKDVLWRVACAGEGLEAAERALGWPPRAGKVVLGIALDRLADHYRLG